MNFFKWFLSISLAVLVTAQAETDSIGIVSSSISGEKGTVRVTYKKVENQIQFESCNDKRQTLCTNLGTIPAPLVFDAAQIEQYADNISWQEGVGGILGLVAGGALGVGFGLKQGWKLRDARVLIRSVKSHKFFTAVVGAVGAGVSGYVGWQIGDSLDGKELSEFQIKALTALSEKPELLYGENIMIEFKMAEYVWLIQEAIAIIGTPATQ